MGAIGDPVLAPFTHGAGGAGVLFTDFDGSLVESEDLAMDLRHVFFRETARHGLRECMDDGQYHRVGAAANALRKALRTRFTNAIIGG